MQIYFQKKLLVISGVFLILSFSLFIFLYFKVAKNDRLAKETSKTWQLEVEKREKLNSLDSLVKKIANEKTALETHFAKSSDIVPFLDTLDTIGNLAKVESNVSAVDILADKSGLVAEVKAEGNFDSVYKFLVLLENSPYELEFSSMNIRRDDVLADTSKSAPLWNATFKIKLLGFMP